MDSENVSIPSEMAQQLKVADENDAARYDAAAKELVAQKSVLAYIMKGAMPEYKAFTVQKIAREFIVGNPEVRTVAVHQDHPDREKMSGNDKVEGLPTEQKSQKEGTVTFDIYFKALIPESGELVDVFINIEVQNNDIPGYPIPKRGVYNLARMISSEYGKVFKNEDYGKLRKAVSIWICEDTAKKRSDTINRYTLAEECVRGDFHEPRQNYDLLSLVVFRLGEKGEGSSDDAICLLSTLFSTNLPYEEKKNTLENKFHISMTEEMKKEILDMCNLSTGIYNKGYNKGSSDGYDKGSSDGKIKQAKETAYELHSMGMSDDNIARALKYNISIVKEWLTEPQASPET